MAMANCLQTEHRLRRRSTNNTDAHEPRDSVDPGLERERWRAGGSHFVRLAVIPVGVVAALLNVHRGRLIGFYRDAQFCILGRVETGTGKRGSSAECGRGRVASDDVSHSNTWVYYIVGGNISLDCQLHRRFRAGDDTQPGRRVYERDVHAADCARLCVHMRRPVGDIDVPAGVRTVN